MTSVQGTRSLASQVKCAQRATPAQSAENDKSLHNRAHPDQCVWRTYDLLAPLSSQASINEEYRMVSVREHT